MAESILNFAGAYWFWGSVGFIIGSILVVRNMLKNDCSFPVAVITITVGIYAGLFATRVLYVLIFYPRLFLDNLPLALAFWQQTGTWLGVPFGALGCFIILKIAKKPFWTNMGCIAPGLALAHAICRIGCLCSGCCYGAPTSVPWAIYSKELNTMVHPTQIYSMIGELTCVVILQLLWRKPQWRKYGFCSYGMLLATHRFISEFFRGSERGPEIISHLRVFQTVCVFIFVISLGIFVILKWKRRGWIIAAVLIILTAIATVILGPRPESELIAARAQSQLYLVVTRSCFAGQLADWKAQRTKEGFTVAVHGWENVPSSTEIKDWIKAQAEAVGGICSYILIVGDCAADEDQVTRWHIPSVKHVLQQGDKTTESITDILYGDLDGDNCPDVPVGRLTVQNAAQLKTQIDKILTYKHQVPSPEWFRTIIWTGAKGYTSQMQNVTNVLIQLLPKWMDRFIISADVRSAYSGYPPDQPKIFLDEISRGAFLSIVASHGSFRSITPTIYEGKEIFLCVEDVAQLTSRRPAGPMFLLGCDSGKFDTSQSLGPSLAEAFAAHPTGPVGVVSATGPTNPVTNYFITKTMIEQIDRKQETIGDFLLAVQRRFYRHGKLSLLQLAQDDELAKQLIQVVPAGERPMLTAPELPRKEILMYNLIGDPASTLKLPHYMPTSVVSTPEGQMVVSGRTPTQCRRLFVKLAEVEQKNNLLGPNPSKDERQAAFRKANESFETLVNQPLSDKSWQLSLPVSDMHSAQESQLLFIALGRQGCYVAVRNPR